MNALPRLTWLVALLATFPAVVAAQEAPSAVTLDTVVVTVQKRPETEKNVPVAMTVIENESLERLRIRDHDENLVVLAGVLELHPELQRTDVVADMQSSGGPISSQYNLFHYSFPFACFVFFG